MRECAHIRALYMEKITMLDKRIGKVLDSIHQKGLWDETMVVIMADHGQPMGEGEHGIMRKSRPWPYEELVHIHWLVDESEKNSADCAEGSEKEMSEEMWTCPPAPRFRCLRITGSTTAGKTLSSSTISPKTNRK